VDARVKPGHDESGADIMHHIILDSETDFGGWRTAARALVLNDVTPADVTWTVRGHGPDLSEISTLEAPLEPPHGTFNVPAKFVELAKTAILHCDAERFALLYRLLWRLRRDHDLLDIADDPDVAHIHAMAKAVHHEAQRMQTSIRFREIGREHNSHFVAWFEPAHHVVELAAPFFTSRYADMPWSILTSDVCAHWDGHAVSITPGIGKAELPADNRLEEIWQRHFAAVFNPVRLSPKKSRNLPEASTIRPTRESATPPEPAMTRHGAESLRTLREEAADCRACHLYEHATQTVFGEGPQSAQVMLVGEQPGDKEDLAGKPFVGPAGQMLDRALEEAGIDRKKVYVTNAVKHFKFVPRGKIRLHQKPNTPEIKACRQWYERELASIKPDLVVALGTTAAQCVFNKLTPINKNRGRLINLDEGVKALVTVHPSYLLRLPDEDAKAREYQRFVEDLKIAAELLRKCAQAAA
jgi:uracil-DNA glycosylase